MRHDRRRDAPNDRSDLSHRTGPADRRPGPRGAECRPCRGPGAGRAGRRLVRMAEDRRPGQSRRLADGRRQTARHRRPPARQDERAQARGDRADAGRDDRRCDRWDRGHRSGQEEDLGDELLGLIFTACHPDPVARRPRSPHPAGRRRPFDRRDRPRLPVERGDDCPAHRPRQEDHRQGRARFRGAARRRTGGAVARGAGGHLPHLQ